MTWSLHSSATLTNASGDVHTVIYQPLLTRLAAQGWTVDTVDSVTSNVYRSDWINLWDGSVPGFDIGWKIYMDFTTSEYFRVQAYSHATTTAAGYIKASDTFTSGDTVKFYTSDESDGLLVLSGKKLVFFWPGSNTQWGFWANPELLGTAEYVFHAHPMMDGDWSGMGMPVTSSTTGAGYYGFAAGNRGTSYTAGPGKWNGRPLMVKAPMITGSSSSGSSATTYGPAFKMESNDTAVHVSNNNNTQYPKLEWQPSTSGSMYDGTDYWIVGSSTIDNNTTLAFNTGAVEPTF